MAELQVRVLPAVGDQADQADKPGLPMPVLEGIVLREVTEPEPSKKPQKPKAKRPPRRKAPAPEDQSAAPVTLPFDL